MIKKLLSILFMFQMALTFSQTISIVGTGVNGWTPTNGPEITLSTNDNITYTINNLVVATGFVKFRQDYGWDTNWGASTFPNGEGVQNGPDIPTVAGTYDVTFNRLNGSFTFIGSTTFPIISLWGTAVDSQNGFGGNDVDMITEDGILYTLSGFNFSSGSAYFRQDNASNFVWGVVAFPSGTAVLGGPTIPVVGGEWFVTFNRITGEFSFEYPRIGILGTALNGFQSADTNLNTTNGFNYSIENLVFSTGEVKFRKDDSWSTNWGATDFPNGTGTQNGPNIPVIAGTYNVTFERTSGNYTFTNTLSLAVQSLSKVKVYPNPAADQLIISANIPVEELLIMDVLGKKIASYTPFSQEITIPVADYPTGMYVLKIASGKDFMVQQWVKK